MTSLDPAPNERLLRTAITAGRDLARFGDLQLWLESQATVAELLTRMGRVDEALVCVAEPLQLARRQGLSPLVARLEGARDGR